MTTTIETQLQSQWTADIGIQLPKFSETCMMCGTFDNVIVQLSDGVRVGFLCDGCWNCFEGQDDCDGYAFYLWLTDLLEHRERIGYSDQEVILLSHLRKKGRKHLSIRVERH